MLLIQKVLFKGTQSTNAHVHQIPFLLLICMSQDTPVTLTSIVTATNVVTQRSVVILTSVETDECCDCEKCCDPGKCCL